MQEWRFEKTTCAGYGILVHKQSGNVLDSNGSKVYMLGGNGGGYQLWKPVLSHHQNGKMWFRLFHYQSGGVLDSNGSEVYVLKNNGGDYQLWSF